MLLFLLQNISRFSYNMRMTWLQKKKRPPSLAAFIGHIVFAWPQDKDIIGPAVNSGTFLHIEIRANIS